MLDPLDADIGFDFVDDDAASRSGSSPPPSSSSSSDSSSAVEVGGSFVPNTRSPSPPPRRDCDRSAGGTPPSSSSTSAFQSSSVSVPARSAPAVAAHVAVPVDGSISGNDDDDGGDGSLSPPGSAAAAATASIDSERQILLLMLLAQVCALHDPTPKTFTVHVLNLFERGVLDRDSVKFLFDLGLVPGDHDQLFGGASPRILGGDDDNGGMGEEGAVGSRAIVPYQKNRTMASFALSRKLRWTERQIESNRGDETKCELNGGGSFEVEGSTLLRSSSGGEASIHEGDESSHERRALIERSRAEHEARRRLQEVSAIRQSLEKHESASMPPLSSSATMDVAAATAAASSSSSWSVDRHPLSLSRYSRDFVQHDILSSGAFGDVFRASNRLDGRDYAVKRVAFSARGYSDESVRLVVREVECLARVDHTHCVRYYTSWMEPGWMTGGGEEEGNGTEGHLRREGPLLLEYGPSFDNETIDNSESSYGAKRHGLSALREKSSRGRVGLDSSRVSASFDDGFDWGQPDAESHRNEELYNSISIGGYGHCEDDSEYSEWTQNDDSGKNNRTNGSRSVKYQRTGPNDGVTFNKVTDESDRKLPFQGVSTKEKQKRTQKDKSRAYRYQICLFIQMELCHPSTLADWIERRNELSTSVASHNQTSGAYSTALAFEAFRQIASGLAHVHARGIVHRDLKPANVFASMSEDSHGSIVFKVGDFGLSKLLVAQPRESAGAKFTERTSPEMKRPFRFPQLVASGHDPQRRAEPASAFKRAGAKQARYDEGEQHQQPHTAGVGTASYAAPEQIETSTYGPEADVFSLGLILLELMGTFGSAHERASAFSDCRRRGESGGGSLPWLARRHQGAAALVAACTLLDPRDRPTARDVEKEAEALCRTGDLSCESLPVVVSNRSKSENATCEVISSEPASSLKAIAANSFESDNNCDAKSKDLRLDVQCSRLQKEVEQCKEELKELRAASIEKDKTIEELQKKLAKMR